MPKYENTICEDKMTFQECELAILRKAIDEGETKQGEMVAKNEDVKKIIGILEDFLKIKRVICYGGTAINNILPKNDQFYDKDIEVPDYDFYSNSAMDHAIELANIYNEHGYTEVEAKAGVHHGTYKVYVNFLPIADITQLHSMIFDELYEASIKIAGIRYASPDFLRMGMFLELSRPNGDISRWEKVHKRLILLNKHYPFKSNTQCDKIEFQRKMNRPLSGNSVVQKDNMTIEEIEAEVFTIVRDELASHGAVFFGGYACGLYAKHMKDGEKQEFAKIPDFDVIIEDSDHVALIIKEQLEQSGYTKILLIEHAEIGEIVPRHIEIKIGKESIAFLYDPIACHNYNTITVGNDMEINVATIDTILTFYLAFMYTKKLYYYKDRLSCLAEYLYDLQEDNRLNQKGLLKRFSMKCYGKQPTMEDIRAKKAQKYAEMASKKGTHEYEEWFLNYKPSMGKKKTTVSNGIGKNANNSINDAKKIIKSPKPKSRQRVTHFKQAQVKTRRKTRAIRKPKNEYLF